VPAVGHRHRHRPGPGEDGGQIGFAFELGDGAGCRGADCELGEGIRAVLESLRCDRITRGEVKVHVCNSKKAKDANVRQALIDRLGKPGTKKAPGPTYGIAGDVWAALAVAVTWWDSRAVRQIAALGAAKEK
jgi:hypothetical protein